MLVANICTQLSLSMNSSSKLGAICHLSQKMKASKRWGSKTSKQRIHQTGIELYTSKMNAKCAEFGSFDPTKLPTSTNFY